MLVNTKQLEGGVIKDSSNGSEEEGKRGEEDKGEGEGDTVTIAFPFVPGVQNHYG